MAEVVVDTNVLYVAERLHPDVSEECVLACVERLKDIMKRDTVVLDDEYRVLSEYQNKIDPKRSKGPGAIFLKWLLQRQTNAKRVARVHISEHAKDCFHEFPVAKLEAQFDPPDRKFPAVANVHPSKPAILQAADCKWLRWWPELKAAGIRVEFLCPDDVCRFYTKKFPKETAPQLP